MAFHFTERVQKIRKKTQESAAAFESFLEAVVRKKWVDAKI